MVYTLSGNIWKDYGGAFIKLLLFIAFLISMSNLSQADKSIRFATQLYTK